MVLPTGFALPPAPYALAIAVGLLVVGLLLLRDHPAVSERTVLAAAPWMVAGAALHAVHRTGGAGDAVEPFLGVPAVYLSTAAVAGGVWWLADRTRPEAAGPLAGSGAVAGLLAIGWLVSGADGLGLWWPLVGLGLGLAVAAGAWLGLRAVAPEAATTTGTVGGLVLVAHSIDGVSTAIGFDVLGFGERTPVSRLILEAAATLPTAELLGAGWLFVVVKVAVATAVVWVFADFVREDPTQAYLLLGGVAAVGLGPGVHNLLLYAVR